MRSFSRLENTPYAVSKVQSFHPSLGTTTTRLTHHHTTTDIDWYR